MNLEPDIANLFIREYMAFLLFCYKERCDEKADDELINMLSFGRDAYDCERALIDKYETINKSVSPFIIKAIRSLVVTNWVYLYDTTKYSLFVNQEGTAAYAVVGLTQPIKDIFGCSSLYMKAGIVELEEKYVCDGLLANQVKLGKGYRDQFNDIYRELKKSGRFFKTWIKR